MPCTRYIICFSNKVEYIDKEHGHSNFTKEVTYALCGILSVFAMQTLAKVLCCRSGVITDLISIIVFSAPVKVLFSLAINKSRAVRVQIGGSAYFKCSKKSIRANSALSYTWGNRYKNSSKNFQIESSERVWINSYGWLVYSTFRQQDADLINKKGIRCFIKQKYQHKVEEIVSDVLHIVVDSK